MQEAVERSGVNGVIGIIDTCAAAAAQPRLPGQTRLSLLMACPVGDSTYDMNMSRHLAELLHAGIPLREAQLGVLEVAGLLQAVLPEQALTTSEHNGDLRQERSGWAKKGTGPPASSLGSYGMTELATAMRAFRSDWAVPDLADLARLRELEQKVKGKSSSLERDRVAKVIENLIIASQTILFLRRLDTTGLTTDALRHALKRSDNTDRSSLAVIMDMEFITEAYAVEHVALNYATKEETCRPRMARFLVTLLDSLGINPDGHEMRSWADAVQAKVAFGDALKEIRKQQVGQRFRLVISLQHTLAGEWPSQLSYWLRNDGEPLEHDIIDCAPNQQGVEDAVEKVVTKAAIRARRDKAQLEYIDVAAPAGILLRWRPEEVAYGNQHLGFKHTVLPRWSRRLEEGAEVFQMNDIALSQMRDILESKQGRHLRWVTVREVTDLAVQGKKITFPAVGLLDHPGESPGLMELLLKSFPVLLWPASGGLGTAHRRRVDSCWHGLPDAFLAAYRARWETSGAIDLVGDIRAVWEDEDWLRFCLEFQIQS